VILEQAALTVFQAALAGRAALAVSAAILARVVEWVGLAAELEVEFNAAARRQ